MLSQLVTIIVLSCIFFLFIKSIKKNSQRNFKNEIVSLGVLGTFVGISIGLYSFDVSNIKDSIPFLLGGLKTAFITSGVGIFFSILISIFKPISDTKPANLNDVTANQEKIISTLEKSLDAISKSANEEIIIALEQVVNKFNENLTTQFGDNFKELNSAVKEMTTWQDNYKNHIKEYEESLSNVMINLEKISEIKNEQEKNIENIINNLSTSSTDISASLKKSTDVVEESLQLLLRTANSKI